MRASATHSLLRRLCHLWGGVNVELQCGNGRTCTIPAFVARSDSKGIAVEWRELAPAAILAMMMQALGQNNEAPARAFLLLPGTADLLWKRLVPPYSFLNGLVHVFSDAKTRSSPVKVVIIKSLGPPGTDQACRNSAARAVLLAADLTHTP